MDVSRGWEWFRGFGGGKRRSKVCGRVSQGYVAVSQGCVSVSQRCVSVSQGCVSVS